MADALSTLAEISDHWLAQGWSLDDLAAFRMEGEGAAAPDLNSIIDAGLANEPAEPEPAAPAVPAAPAAPTPPAAPAADPFDAGADSFDRKYVESLRTENAKYRTERNELQATFGQAFDGYDPADRDTLLAVARGLRSDDPQVRADVAEWMRTTAEAVGTPPPAAPGADQPLTAAELDRILTQRENSKAEADAQAQRLAAINNEVTELGYTTGSVDAQVLLGIALHETNGDIAAAHAKLQARDEAAVAKFLETKKAEAENGTGVVPPSGGAAPVPAQIKSTKDAKAALEAHFDALGFK